VIKLQAPPPSAVLPRREIEFNGKVVTLGAIEHRLLEALVEAGSGTRLTRDRLTLAGWPESPEGNPNRLDQALLGLRSKLPGLIGNDWARGWFIVPGTIDLGKCA
jgi:DNA-binding winged helix-turn-helix (wHTH) protein